MYKTEGNPVRNLTGDSKSRKQLQQISQDDYDVKYLGIGSAKTWHGSSEIRIQSCNMIGTDEHLFEGEPVYMSDDEESVDDPSASFQPGSGNIEVPRASLEVHQWKFLLENISGNNPI